MNDGVFALKLSELFAGFHLLVPERPLFVVSFQDYLRIRNIWEVVFDLQTRDACIQVSALRPCFDVDEIGVLPFNPISQIIFFPLLDFLVNYLFEVLYRKFKIFFIDIDESRIYF